MKITDYKIRIIDKENTNIIASFEINFDYVLTVKDILLIKSKNNDGVFITMPSKQFPDKETGEAKYKSYVEISDSLNEYLRKFCHNLYLKEVK